MKNIFTWLFSIVLIILIVVAFKNKNGLNDFIAEKMKTMVDKETAITVAELIETKYNYSKNGLDYEFTLFEFSSNSCINCKKMEAELEKIRKSHSDKINVVFVNTTFPKNQQLIQYIGIPAIPMQVILNKEGNEIFKHYGFISAEELINATTEKS